jgi:hypothetical protein
MRALTAVLALILYLVVLWAIGHFFWSDHHFDLFLTGMAATGVFMALNYWWRRSA